jgi:hypothetical protein
MVAVDAELTAALEPVLADLANAVHLVPDIRGSDFGGPGSLCAVLTTADGGSVGIRITDGNDHSSQVVDLADQIQDWAVEELWSAGRSPVWPTCPEHPDVHPLAPTETDGRAVWTCPKTSKVVATIGHLAE